MHIWISFKGQVQALCQCRIQYGTVTGRDLMIYFEETKARYSSALAIDAAAASSYLDEICARTAGRCSRLSIFDAKLHCHCPSPQEGMSASGERHAYERESNMVYCTPE
jgi:hypothetical protein